MAIKSGMNDGFVLESLARKYARNGKKPIQFDFKVSSSDLLGNANRSIKEAQYLHYYPGRIFPYIPYYMLSLKDFESFNGYLLDPFAGSGTILLESISNPVIKRNAFGVEINPVGRLISKVKTTPLDIEKIEQHIDGLSHLYKNASNIEDYIPEFKNRELWFSENTITKLARLKYAIRNLDVDSDYKDFFWVCFSNIIRKVSKANPYIPPPVVLKPEKYKRTPRKYERFKRILKNAENPEMWKRFEEVVHSNKNRLSLLNRFEEIKERIIRSEIIWDDARDIKRGQLCECGRIDKQSIGELLSGSIDLIFTSPPYITAQKYIRTNRLELFWLGYSEEEVKILEKLSIGTERVRKDSAISSLGIESIDSVINYALPLSLERALMVFKYFKEMVECLKEMYRLLKEKGYAILVVGNNRVLQKKVATYKLLSDAAIELGFRETAILRDSIQTRSMMTKRNDTGGIIKDEYIIVLRKEA